VLEACQNGDAGGAEAVIARSAKPGVAELAGLVAKRELLSREGEEPCFISDT
jgi:hypothetical protein